MLQQYVSHSYWRQSVLSVGKMNSVTSFLVSKKLKAHLASQFVYFHHVVNLVFNVVKLPNLTILYMVLSKGWERGKRWAFPPVSSWFPNCGWKEHWTGPLGQTGVRWCNARHCGFCSRGRFRRGPGFRLGSLQTWFQVLTCLIPDSTMAWWYFKCWTWTCNDSISWKWFEIEINDLKFEKPKFWP